MSKEKNTVSEPQAAPVTPTPALSAPPTAPAPPDNSGEPVPPATLPADGSHDSHDSHDSQTTPPPGPSTDELIRQAYLRGRNEAIDELMRQPAMLQPLDTAPRKRDNRTAAPEIMILNSPRPSIWDK